MRRLTRTRARGLAQDAPFSANCLAKSRVWPDRRPFRDHDDLAALMLFKRPSPQYAGAHCRALGRQRNYDLITLTSRSNRTGNICALPRGASVKRLRRKIEREPHVRALLPKIAAKWATNP